MYLKQNNFFSIYYNTVECYIPVSSYVSNPMFNTTSETLCIFIKHSNTSHKYYKVKVGYVLSK